MIFTSLDQICRRTLLERRMPIHYYMENLVHASSCLRQMTIDTLKIINTIELPVNPTYQAVDLPDDFVEDVAVMIPAGEALAPVAKFDYINPIRYHDDTTGLFIPPPCSSPSQQEGLITYGYNINWIWFWNINDYGEPTGRYFGATGGAKQNGYTLVKERNQIQLTQSFTSPTIVLMYISDGQSSSAATQIDISAIDAIQAYQAWKTSRNANNGHSPEADNWYNQRRLCRARNNDLTVTDIRTIVLNAYTAAIKN